MGVLLLFFSIVDSQSCGFPLIIRLGCYLSLRSSRRVARPGGRAGVSAFFVFVFGLFSKVCHFAFEPVDIFEIPLDVFF